MSWGPLAVCNFYIARFRHTLNSSSQKWVWLCKFRLYWLTITFYPEIWKEQSRKIGQQVDVMLLHLRFSGLLFLLQVILCIFSYPLYYKVRAKHLNYWIVFFLATSVQVFLDFLFRVRYYGKNENIHKVQSLI